MTSVEIQEAIQKLDDLVKKTSQYIEAKALAYELLEIPEIQKDIESLSKIYNPLGIANAQLSEYPKALKYFEKALQINEEISNKSGIANNITNIGIVYNLLSDYPKALEYFEKALVTDEEIGNKTGIARHIGNIGEVYNDLSDYPKALEYFEKALLINEEIGNTNGIARHIGNIGIIYKNLSDYPKALEYYKKALYTYEEINNKLGISATLKNIGIVYRLLFDYPKALEYYEKTLLIDEEIGNKSGIAANLGNIGNVYCYLSDYPKALEYFQKALHLAEEIGNKNFIATNIGSIGQTYILLADYPKALEYLTISNTLSKEISAKDLTMESLKAFSELYEKMGDIVSAFSYYKQYIDLKDEIQSEETKKKATHFDQQRKIEEDQKARELKLARFQEQENLLYNILPSTIANRILKRESFIADNYDSSTVLFMDIVGFTRLSSIAPPKQIVYLLDTIFTKADEILEQYGLEKIKTIGDGYMAVANVTTSLENHQKSTASAALELLQGMKDLVINFPEELGDSSWTKNMNELQIRIGIHTGEVVAGVIGKNKYTFDLWGDAVNVASRMESNSEPGRIHVSEGFAKSIELHSEFKLVPRGEITIKGKGVMNTYWLEKTQ